MPNLRATLTLGPRPCAPRAVTTIFSVALSMTRSVESPNTLNMTGDSCNSGLGANLALTLVMPPPTELICKEYQDKLEPHPVPSPIQQSDSCGSSHAPAGRPSRLAPNLPTSCDKCSAFASAPHPTRFSGTLGPPTVLGPLQTQPYGELPSTSEQSRAR